jgi:ferredoxin
MVIYPDECIDCGVCEPECPVDAIKPDTEAGLEKWLGINAEYARVWPNLSSEILDASEQRAAHLFRASARRGITGHRWLTTS